MHSGAPRASYGRASCVPVKRVEKPALGGCLQDRTRLHRLGLPVNEVMTGQIFANLHPVSRDRAADEVIFKKWIGKT